MGFGKNGRSSWTRCAGQVLSNDPACRGGNPVLAELQREDLIPSEAKDPDFRAKAEFSSWLAHPAELGRPPERLEIADHRLLDWPPAGDRIPLWIVRYELDSDSAQGDPQSDCGLVGSTTWCFFERFMDLRPPEDCYAVHCCWELGLYPDEVDDSLANTRGNSGH